MGAKRRQGPAHTVLLEPLEPRLLLSADLIPLHVDMADADIGDDITLRLDATTNTLEVYQNANPAVGPVVSQKLNETSEIVVSGVDDRDDTLTVDFTSPFFLNIDYDGGAGGFDSLVVEGGTFDSAVYDANSPDSGAISLSKDTASARISYTGLEPITVDSNVTDVVFNVNVADQRITLSDHADAGFSQIDSPGMELHKFGNATTNKVTINAFGGNNTFVLEQLDSDFTAAITLNGVNSTTDTDAIEVARDADFTLSDTELKIDAQIVTLTSIEAADLTGAADGSTYTLSGWSGDATLRGQAGNDVYAFSDGFNAAIIADSGGDDKLDVMALTGPLTVSPDKTVITEQAGGGTITQTGDIVERFDADFDAARFETALDELQDFVDELQAAGGDLQALVNQVPLLDRLVDGGIADLVQLSESVTSFIDAAQDEITNESSLEALVSVIKGLLLDAGAPPDTLTVRATSGYQAGSGGALELLIGLQLDANRSRDDIALDLGIEAGNQDIGVEGTLSVDALLDIDLTLGFTTAGPDDAFMLEDGVFGLELTAATATLTKINLGFLELDVDAGSASVDGRVEVTLADSDTDNHIDFGADPISDVTSVAVTDPGTPGFFTSTVSLTPIPIETIDLGGGPIANATFNLSLPGGVNPFGNASGNVEPTIDISADGPSGAPLDLLDFSNVTPSEILGMLGEVADLLGSIGDSKLLEIGIPFTELNLGDILDFGDSFKETILDPLFTSGDALRPDNNEDGQIDWNDITFTSIQGLLDRLEDILDPDDILGLDLNALYDSGVHVSTPDSGQAVTATQTITVHNAKSGTYTLSLAGFGTTANIEWDAAAEGGTDSVQALLNVILVGAVPAINVASVKFEEKDNGDRVYEIEFSRNPNVRLTADSSNLVEVDNPHRELTFAIEFDRSFGFGQASVATRQTGGDGLDEVQTVTINATGSGGELDDEFTLGLRGSSTGAPFFTSGIAHDASADDVEAALESLGVSIGVASDTTTQVVRLKNTAGNATFELTHSDGWKTGTIAFDASTGDVENAFPVGDSGTVTVSGGGIIGDERVYTLVFATDPGETLGVAVQIDGKDVDVTVEKDDKEYEITFKGGFADANVATLESDSTQLMGAFGFDLGASLGDLASVSTSGSFSPLVNLNAGITFGLDLGPSQELTIVPPVFGPAPAVSVVTVQDGGGGTAEQQIVTVQSANGGTFALQLGDETVSGIPFNVPADQTGSPPLVEGLKQRLNNAPSILSCSMQRRKASGLIRSPL